MINWRDAGWNIHQHFIISSIKTWPKCRYTTEHIGIIKVWWWHFLVSRVSDHFSPHPRATQAILGRPQVLIMNGELLSGIVCKKTVRTAGRKGSVWKYRPSRCKGQAVDLVKCGWSNVTNHLKPAIWEFNMPRCENGDDWGMVHGMVLSNLSIYQSYYSHTSEPHAGVDRVSPIMIHHKVPSYNLSRYPVRFPQWDIHKISHSSAIVQAIHWHLAFGLRVEAPPVMCIGLDIPKQL